jgi:hypothetical protein
MSIYNENSKTTTSVIVPCCFVKAGGWPARHLWRWTDTGKKCERCGAKITITLPEGYDADKPPKTPPREN